ncbi:MAG: heme exporter protein CcmB [Sphingobium sp.]
MRLLLLLVRRDVALAYRAGGALLPVAFFLLVATLFPFAVGPDAQLLARTGGGVVWISALLAALLPIERLIEPDTRAGVLDQIAIRGVSDEAVAATRILSHWLSFGPPLMLATLPASALLNLDGATLWRLEIGLAMGTPGLAALGVMIGAITAGLRGAGALAGLLLLPLAVPLIIFGAGSLGEFGGGGLKLLAAASLILVGMGPFAAGAAIRAGRE